MSSGHRTARKLSYVSQTFLIVKISYHFEKKFFVGTGFPRKILALMAIKVYNGVKLEFMELFNLRRKLPIMCHCEPARRLVWQSASPAAEGGAVLCTAKENGFPRQCALLPGMTPAG